MHSKAKRAFLSALLEGPLTRPTGFAGGQPGWDHNVNYFVARGYAEVCDDDGLIVVTLNEAGEGHALFELSKPERAPRGRPNVKSIAFGDMTPEQQATIRQQWANDKKPT